MNTRFPSALEGVTIGSGAFWGKHADGSALSISSAFRSDRTVKRYRNQSYETWLATYVA